MRKNPIETLVASPPALQKPHRKAASWGWKLATDIDDALNFLNGTGAYETPIRKARISAFWKDNHPEFYIYYQHPVGRERRVSWGWKLAATPGDARNFLSGAGSYGKPVKDAQIAAYRKGRHDEFYIFYQNASPYQRVYGNWGWKLATDPMDAIRFLNGDGIYRHPVTTARVALVNRGSYPAFYIFYQKAVQGESVPNWYWKLATSPNDAHQFINGTGGYEQPVKGFEMGALDMSTHNRFYVFANQGRRLWLQQPLPNERFVQGEAINLKALYTSERPKDSHRLLWTSSLDGELGSGAHLNVANLSVGEHQIQVRGYGLRVTQGLRIFADLWAFYKAQPAQEEIDRTMRDFNFNWVDGDGEDEKWENYGDFEFDPSSDEPAKLVAVAKVDMLRHQHFSEPLPFTNKTIFEHLRQEVKHINLKIDDSNATGGGDSVSLHRTFSRWSFEYKSPPALILVHEGRHCEEGDPGHTSCHGKSNMDASFDTPGGSAHARTALYMMWVYKYSLYDTEEVKNGARRVAESILSSRFCSTPTHSNPKVQAIIDELLT